MIESIERRGIRAQQWVDAINNFVIKQSNFVGDVEYIHAEADTGSKYEVASYVTNSYWRNRDGHTMFIAVSQPWERVWTSNRSGFAYPDYVCEHWGPPSRKFDDVHGGDLAAVAMCINLLKGNTLEQARAAMLDVASWLT